LKNIHFLLLGTLFIGMVTFLSCDNTLDLIEERMDIPIVYGLLSTTDTAQYIRVERAFVDETISAIELAQDPDALYYENVDVSIIRLSNNETSILERVDGNEEGFPRQEGAFATAPNFLYKISTSEINLVEGEEYQLSIERGEPLATVTASTTLVEAPLISRPSSGSRLDFFDTRIQEITWLGNENNSLYDVSLLLRFFEKNLDVPNSAFEQREVLWSVERGIEPNSGELRGEALIEGNRFFGFLAGALDREANYDRRFIDIDLILDAGGAEIAQYQNVGLANLSITSSQDIPTFTNLSEGRGLFSSRTRIISENIEVTPRTLDSLANGAITAGLGFQ